MNLDGLPENFNEWLIILPDKYKTEIKALDTIPPDV